MEDKMNIQWYPGHMTKTRRQMEADLKLVDGDYLLLINNPLCGEFEQGDIVVASMERFKDGEAIVKRVIATEGQTVDIDFRTGVVYVDGEALEEDYILEEMYLPGSGHMQKTHFEVPEDEIFVLGDNRNGSTDSRDERLGTIHEGYVLGKAVAAIWPMEKFGLI